MPQKKDDVSRDDSLQAGQSAKRSDIDVDIGGDVIGNLIVAGGNVTHDRDMVAERNSAIKPYFGKLHHDAMQSGLLRTLEPRSKDPSYTGKQVTVDQVYIPPDTQSLAFRNKDGSIRWEAMERKAEVIERNAEASPLSAMEAANHFDHLVLLGDPGSGKSTFVGFLALCLTGHFLDPEGDWLDRLSEQGWERKPPIPVHVTLRLFAQDMGETEMHGTAQSLLSHIARMMEQCGCPEAMGPIRQAMIDGNALLILDGLDEVPADKRAIVRDTVEMFMQAFDRCRVVITCRVLSYENPEWQIPDTEEVRLAPFDREKIQRFIRAWYTASAAIGNIDDREAQELTADLTASVSDRYLQDMAKNPMLLTVMAIVHSYLEALPRESARLYLRCVEILMLKWKPIEADHLQEVLKLPDETDLYRILWQVAYEAHEKQGAGEGAADIPKKDVMEIAAQDHLGDDWSKAQLFCDYVEERAGLLIGRGGGDGERRMYAFPHRTFQEYLAGCYMADEANFPQSVDEKARSGAHWREVVLLATGHMYFNKTDRNQPLMAIQLILQDEPKSYEDWQAIALAGDMLLLIGIPTVEKIKIGASLLHQARDRISRLVGEGRLEPRERAAAGRTLAILGDPRPGVGVKDGLSDIDWVPIPGAKRFRLLTDKGDKGTYDIAPFRMAKYPVTHVQFQAFLDDPEGRPNPRWWEGLAAPPKHRAGPDEQYFKFDNHPRENVSWWDAMAFCAWLSDRLGQPTLYEWLAGGRNWQSYPGVRLPTEWEWQWAAQGPDGREYPYEGEFDSTKGNTSETGIGQTSAVGIFPQGASPYDVLDMSGNVWEWCLNDHYNPKNIGLAGNAARVLRGGSWLAAQDFARCAYRNFNSPSSRFDSYGFRVCASPFSK